MNKTEGFPCKNAVGKLVDGSVMTGYICGKSMAGNLHHVMSVAIHHY